MLLTDAISAVETANNSYTNAVNQTNTDQAAADQIKAKLDAANQTVASDQAAQSTAAAEFNAALDTLIQAATAAKIPDSTPVKQ